eukprot:m.153459 g.153459  ORF g.153459 m.153459 type:complete len:409 (+) comp23450_c0_seq3:213-1439(+)
MVSVLDLPWGVITSESRLPKRDLMALMATCKTLYARRRLLLRSLTSPHAVCWIRTAGRRAVARFAPTNGMIAIGHGIGKVCDDAFKWVASTPGTECLLSLWRVAADNLSLMPVHEVPGVPAGAEVHDIAWHADGTRLAAVCDDALLVWDVTDPARTAVVAKPPPFRPGQNLMVVAWEPRAPNRIVVGGRFDAVILLSRDCEVLASIPTPDPDWHGSNSLTSLAWAPDGPHRLAVGGLQKAEVWAMPPDLGGRGDTAATVRNFGTGLAWHPDGRHLAASRDYISMVFDLDAPNDETFACKSICQQQVDVMIYSPTSGLLASAGFSGDDGHNYVLVFDGNTPCDKDGTAEWWDGIEDLVSMRTQCYCDCATSTLSWWKDFLLLAKKPCGHIQLYRIPATPEVLHGSNVRI